MTFSSRLIPVASAASDTMWQVGGGLGVASEHGERPVSPPPGDGGEFAAFGLSPGPCSCYASRIILYCPFYDGPRIDSELVIIVTGAASGIRNLDFFAASIGTP